MKKLFTLLALVLCSCAETFVGKEIAKPNSENLPDLTAAFAEEDATRTYIENGKYLRWCEDDRLTIFFGNSLNRQYKFNGQTGDNSGTFSLVPDGMLGTGNAFDRIYALYPYNADACITDEGVISLTLPTTQTYAENSFGLGANTMVAVTENLEDTFLAFKNVGGYLKLKLYNTNGATIKSIEVKGNNGEKLAGDATLSINFGETPILTMADAATDTVVLDCGNGVALGTTAEEATELWVVLPVTTFAEGLTITATDVNGGVFEKSTTNEIIIERNAIQPMAALEAKFIAPQPANNEIWYTSIDEEVVEPYKNNAFGANIISNVYKDGQGIITFDGDVTTIGSYAFSNCTRLKSIILPNCVTTLSYGIFNNCNNMQELTIPSSVTTFNTYDEPLFNGCTGKLLIDCNIPNSYYDREDDEYPIFYGAKFTEIVVGDNVTTLGNNAFRTCSQLATLTLGKNVSTIGSNALAGCTKLTTIKGVHASSDNRCWIVDGTLKLFTPANLTEYTVPNNTTIIEAYAFQDCDSLSNITIQEGVTSLGNFAFYDCDALVSVTLPESIQTISYYVFTSCNKLASIYCKPTTPPSIITNYGWHTFDNIATDARIYVPAESFQEYEIATGWDQYATKIIGYDYAKGEISGILPQYPITYDWYTSTTDGSYEIESPEELVALSRLSSGDAEALAATGLTSAPTFENETIYITADIDLSAYCSKISGSWSPIKNFRGTLIGNNHTISNLYCDTTESTGLFLTVSNATFRDIIVEGKIYCNDQGYVGAITSMATNCLFENCTSDVYIKTYTDSSYTCVGGICGRSENSKYIACTSLGDISDTIDEWEWENYVGGIVGNTQGGDYFIACSKPQGRVVEETTQSYSPVGGILGCVHEYSNVYIQSCYTSIYIQGREPGHITNKGYYEKYTPSAKIASCYYSGTGKSSYSKPVKGVGTRNYSGSHNSYDYGTSVVTDVDAAINDMNANIDKWNSENPTIFCNYKYANYNGNIVLVKMQ